MTIALDPQISDTASVAARTHCPSAVSDSTRPDAKCQASPSRNARPGTPTSDEASLETSTQEFFASSEPSSPAASSGSHAHDADAAGDPTSTRDGHGSGDTQTVPALPGGSQTSGTAKVAASAHNHAAAPEPNFTDSQGSSDPQRSCAVGDPTSPAPKPVAKTHSTTAAGGPGTTGSGQRPSEAQIIAAAPGGWLRDPVIGVLADVLDDLEKVRIANANRVRILTRTEADSDGEERGFGLTEDHPEVKKLALTVKALEAAEHDAILNLQRALRKHPLAPFQKRHKGLGEKQFARLLAVIGDPYYNDLHQRPRTVSELWAYCGFHVLPAGGHHSSGPQTRTAPAGSNPTPGAISDSVTHGQHAPGVAPKRTRGQQSNWSEDARKRVWVIASAMPKFPGGHYEQVYRQARKKYADATHPAECVRCGPAGKPAAVGSDLSDGHKHARAIRIVAKELLKDMWRESRDLYHPEPTEGTES